MYLKNKPIIKQVYYLNPLSTMGGYLGPYIEWHLTKKQINKLKHCENGNFASKQGE